MAHRMGYVLGDIVGRLILRHNEEPVGAAQQVSVLEDLFLRLRSLNVRQRFDEILFLVEEKYLDRKWPSRNLAESLGERIDSIFKIGNKASAFHFARV